MDEPSLAERISHFRRRAGLTQEELARRVDVFPSAVTAWVKGKYSPAYAKLVLIAEACGVSLETFFGPIDDEPASAAGG